MYAKSESVGWVEDTHLAAVIPDMVTGSPLMAVQARIRQQISKIGEVLCHVDKTDGSPSFDLNELASQNGAQMTAVLQSVSAHLNSLDKQCHAEEADAAFGEVLQVLQAGLIHHKQETSQMVSSILEECRKTDAQILSGILEACSSFRREAKQMGADVLEHESAMACWGGAVSTAQQRCQELQADQKLQAASLAAQDAGLCSALEDAGREAALSMQQSLQAQGSMHELWRSSAEAVHLQCAALREEIRLALHELATEAGGLRAAMVQHVTDLQTVLKQSMESVRHVQQEQEQSLLRLEEQEDLLRVAAAAESTLQRRLAEAESEATAWRETAQQELEARECSSSESAEDHEAALDGLQKVIEGLRCQSGDLQAELQALGGREQQHLIDLEQAHAGMSDLRQAAQQAGASQAASCATALEQAASCREDLRDLHAFAAKALAAMADDLASSLHDIPSLLGLTAEAPAFASRSKSSEGAGEGETGEGEAPDPAIGELQAQLSALHAECLEAQRLRDHWHGQYTAQAESGVLAQMQLQQQAEAAAAECAAVRSQLEDQAARAAQAEQQHAANLEACKESGRTDLEEQQAGLEALWQVKLNAAVTAALDRLQQEHVAQLLERVAYLGALHMGKLGSMRDAHLLDREQLQAEIAELQEHHLQQLQRGETAAQLREQSHIEMHAAELQQLVEEQVEAVSLAAADAEQHLQEVLTEADARHKRQLEQQAEEHMAQVSEAQQTTQTSLAEAQQCSQQQLAEADSRLQAMQREMLEQHGILERRLAGSEQAREAQKAAHEKAMSKLTAQQARKATEAERMQRAAEEMLAHHQQLATLEQDRHAVMLHNMQAELQRRGNEMASRLRQHEAELAGKAADMDAATQQHGAALRQAAESFKAELAAASLQHAQQLQQAQAAAEKEAADADERLQDVKDLLLALQARFNNREARPADLEAIKALKDSVRQRDEKLDELSRKIGNLELSRQQLQEEMHLREKNWLANGDMRIGPSLDGAQGIAAKPPPRKTPSVSGP